MFHVALWNNYDFPFQAQEIPGIKIFRCDASLYYANSEFFMNKMYSRTGVNPRKLKLAINKVQKKRDKEMEKRSKELVKLRSFKVRFGSNLVPSLILWPENQELSNLVGSSFERLCPQANPFPGL